MIEIVTPPWNPIFAHRTHPGARGKQNDDAYAHFIGRNSIRDDVHFLVVADGVTSSLGGGIASELAISKLQELLENLSDEPIIEQIGDAVLETHEYILTESRANPALSGMSSTLVLAAIHEEQLYVAHVGDSRAYLSRGKDISQLTVDHTWVQEAVSKGFLTPEQAKMHPNRHVIRRFLGLEPHIRIDYEIINPDAVNDTSQPATVESYTLKPGDSILLCTDGLTDKITEAELQRSIFRHRLNPQTCIDELVGLALHRQEADNITALMVQLRSTTESTLSSFKLSLLLTVSAILIAFLTFAIGNGLSGVDLSAGKNLLPSLNAIGNDSLPTPRTLDSRNQREFAPEASISLAVSEVSEEQEFAPTSAEHNSGTSVGSVSATLLSPLEENLSGIQAFRWETNLALQSNQAIEVAFWEAETDPLDAPISVRVGAESNFIEIDMARVVWANINSLSGISPASDKEFEWGLILVEVEPYKRITQIGKGHSFYPEGS